MDYFNHFVVTNIYLMFLKVFFKFQNEKQLPNCIKFRHWGTTTSKVENGGELNHCFWRSKMNIKLHQIFFQYVFQLKSSYFWHV